MAWKAFQGFEMTTSHGERLRLPAHEVAQRLEIIVDDHPLAEPQRWRLTEKGAEMFSARNVELLVSMGYAQRVS